MRISRDVSRCSAEAGQRVSIRFGCWWWSARPGWEENETGDAALRQRELFGAADYPVQRVDAAERTGDDVDVG